MLLAKGLNFSLPPKYLDYAGYFGNLELLHRNIRNLGILSIEDLDFAKARKIDKRSNLLFLSKLL